MVNDSGSVMDGGDVSQANERHRMSECEEEMPIAPLELEDLCFNRDSDEEKSKEQQKMTEKVTPKDQHFSQPIVNKWRWASRAVLQYRDPWSKYRIVDLYPEEEATRHRYSAYRQQWVTDRVCVKMQTESFGRGAMRECFRLKKIGSSLHNQQQPHGADAWSKALNYVAKRYLTEVDRQIYFNDVQLQADAKLWSEEFNRHNPPKKIDIMQVAILEFPNRDGRPLYHLEHFIEGEYIKYNSNSGFVSDQARQTPQAFSHFVFERSGHQLIVVDVQGVGDLYTDPQIHSADPKTFYGDGDLKTKGMALFFHSHQCNSICDSMNLTPFDLSPNESAALKHGMRQQQSTSQTVCSRDSIEMCQSPAFSNSQKIMNFLRQRTLSKPEADTTEHEEETEVHFSLEGSDQDMSSDKGDRSSSKDNVITVIPVSPTPESITYSRRHHYSSSSTDIMCESGYSSTDYTTSLEVESDQWKEKMEKIRKPSCIPAKDPVSGCYIAPRDESAHLLGTIHMDLVRYYEMGRFNSAESEHPDCEDVTMAPANGINDKIEYDKTSAWFHLDMAARCGILEAIITMARIYLGLSHDLLKDFVFEHDDSISDDSDDSMTHIDHGLDLMEEAAYKGDRTCMLYLADAYENGRNLGSDRAPSWIKAIEWYERALKVPTAEEMAEEGKCLPSATWNDSIPRYKILAKVAEMYHHGGPLLSPNLSKAGDLYSEAAEAATEAMQGKLASKLYMLAEEAWAGVEEEE